MGAFSVGKIGLDLVVNQNQFNKQMTGIQSLAKKAGAALASAFAIKKLVQFGKECVELGSDLAEVQNVVDVTFPAMSAQVDNFAKNAATGFGLSETMAKQFTGTFGAMAKAFGFSEKQAYDMGTTLTGLAGDVASFYNISQDEAYTKLKSVFTGETESLKDLGVVMTQTALDAYAMANGYGKTTSAMSEAEKVALRYAFVQDQLTAAAGDFARTSDSWANQVRLLSLQFDSLKAAIGQGLISALTPVIKVINTVIGRLMTLANAFKALMEGLFGKQDTSSAAAVADASLVAEEAAAGTADSTAETASNLKAASKFLAGFDTIQKVSDSSSSASSGGVGGNVSGMDFSVSTGALDTAETEVSGSLDRIRIKFENLCSYLAGRFAPSFENVWSEMQGPLEGFRTNVQRVFGDLESLAQPFVNYLAGPWLDAQITSFETAGHIASGYLDSLNMVFGDLWDIAVYPFLQRLVSEWLPIYSEFSQNVNNTTRILFDNLKVLFDTLWTEGAKPAVEQICGIFWEFMDILKQFWEEWANPIFANLQEAFNQTKDILLAAWEEIIRPVWEEFMSIVDDLWTNHLAPLVENFLGMVGEFINGALQIYNEFISPVVQWLTTVLAPVFRSVFDTILQLLASGIAGTIDTANGIITAFKGIVQFLTGVFTGDWKKAWTSVKNILKGIFDSLVGVVKTPINGIIDLINGMISGVISGVNSVIRAINSISFDMPSWLGGGHVGFNLSQVSTPRIPRLAEGGYVKANTPRLAMIGDNKRYGEIVAPENKLQEMVDLAVEKAGLGNNEIIALLKTLISLVQDGGDIVLVVDGEELARASQKGALRLKSRYTTISVTVN